MKFKNYNANTKVKSTYGKTNNALITVKSFIQRRVSQLWLWNMLAGASPLSNTTLEMTAYKKHCTCLDAFTDQTLHPAKHLSHPLPTSRLLPLSLLTNTDTQTDTNTVSRAVKDHLTYHVHASFHSDMKGVVSGEQRRWGRGYAVSCCCVAWWECFGSLSPPFAPLQPLCHSFNDQSH